MRKSFATAAGLAAVLTMTWPGIAQTTALPPPGVEGVDPQTLGGKRVTIKVDDAPMSDALYALAQQAGFRFTPRNVSGDANVSVNIQNKPMWEALATILGTNAQNGAASWEMRAINEDSTTQLAGRMSTSGPFLVLARSVMHEADYRRPDSAAEQFYVEVQLLSDPSAWVLVAPKVSLPAKAIDDRGGSLVPATGASDQLAPLSGSRTTDSRLRIALQRPAGAAGEKIHLVEGTIAAALVTKVDKIELKLSEKVVKKYGDMEATFESKTRETAGSEGYDISASFTRPPSMSDDEWNAWDIRLSATRIRLEDSVGQSSTTNSGGGSYGPKNRSMTMHFTARGAGRAGGIPALNAVKAVIEVAQEAKVVNVPYRFEDLPLP